MKIFVGLSGGVDSAVSAALLKEAGHEVTGVFIRIALPGYPCSAGEDKIEAMRVAAHLRIPFLSIDLSQEYADEVFASTIEEFAKGKTPNPDVLCNQKIKFGHFYEFAKSRGAEMIATGHYARTQDGQLYAGVDVEKDQSYFLWMVPEKILRDTLFPVGSLTKKEVRALAAKFGLPNAARHDSQGLCFLGDISIDDMLEREAAPAPGNVLNESGAIVGTHRGALLYTLGQRHGFELMNSAGSTLPHYVIAKDAVANTITVSTLRVPSHATATTVTLAQCNWIGEVSSGTYTARFRYRGALIPAQLTVAEGKAALREPHYVPEGQSLVFYDHERCIGGGVIMSATLQ